MLHTTLLWMLIFSQDFTEQESPSDAANPMTKTAASFCEPSARETHNAGPSCAHPTEIPTHIANAPIPCPPILFPSARNLGAELPPLATGYREETDAERYRRTMDAAAYVPAHCRYRVFGVPFQ